MSVRGRRPAGASVVTLAVALVVLPAIPAAAAGEIEVSSDGSSWGSQLAQPLFSGVALVPLGSAAADFLLRNSSGDDAFLRIVLQDVNFSSPALGDALSLDLVLGGVPGEPAALSSATPCRVLFEGELAAGVSRPVVTTLSLGNLDGRQGQGDTARFSIGIQLSDSTLGGLPPTDCGSPTTVIDVTAFDSRVATIASLGVVPNTWQLFEELLVLFLVVALIVGAAGQWAVAAWIRRRRELAEHESQYLEDLA